MIWFLFAAGLASVAALAVLLRPLLREPRPDTDDAAETPAELFRRQLAAIDEEQAEGRLDAEQAATARTEITRRLLAATDHSEAMPARMSRIQGTRWRFTAAVGIAGLLPAAAMAVYFTFGNPAAIDQNTAADAPPHGAADLSNAAERIKQHLAKEPADLKGWTLLGRTLASLGRLSEAHDAYNHAIALAPADPALHAEFGELLVLQAGGTVTPEAEVEFAKAPDDPRSRYYAAEAALQDGNVAAAKQKFQALLDDAPANAPWRQTVAERLAKLSSIPGSAAAASPAGPDAQDVAAARSMTPEQRQAMIQGMVDRLAQRLQQHPEDKAGWERLAHAYDVLGEADKAGAARQHAATTGNPAGAPPASPATAIAPEDPQGRR